LPIFRQNENCPIINHYKVIVMSQQQMKETIVKFPNGKIENYPRYTIGKELTKNEEFKDLNIVAFLFNKKLVSLHKSLSSSKVEIKPVTLEDDGDAAIFIYTSSLTFVFGMTLDSMMDSKKHTVTSEHQLGQGIYFEISNFEDIDEEFTQKIAKKMRNFIEKDLIIEEDKIPFEDALEYFENQKNQIYSGELIKSKNESFVKVNTCNGYSQLYHTPLSYSTGTLPKDFEIKPFLGGILFEFPNILDLHHIDYFNNSLIPLYKESSKLNCLTRNH
jgi:hypothetical protein